MTRRRRSPNRPFLGFAAAVALAASLPAAGATAPPAVAALLASPDALDPAVAALLAERAAAVEAAPADPAPLALLGAACEANLLWEAARQAYAEAVRRSPEEPLWRLHLAIAERQAGDSDAALERLRALAAETPVVPAALQRLGLALLEAGDLDAAGEAFEGLRQALPESAEGAAGLGEVALRRGEPAAAAVLLAEAVRREPSLRRAHYLLGRAYRDLGRGDEAQWELGLGSDATIAYLPDAFSPEVEAAAVAVTARVDRALAYLRQRRPEAAVAVLEAALADHPGDVTVQNDLATALLQAGDLERAKGLLERARAADDARFATYINLSSWAQRAGRPQQALAYAQGAVERGPTASRSHLAHAQALLALGRLPEAVASLERAVELDFRDVQAALILAAVYTRLGRPAAALAVYAGLAHRQPAVLPAHLGRAAAALAVGRSDEARQALAAARRLAPGHPEVLALEQRLGGGDRQ